MGECDVGAVDAQDLAAAVGHVGRGERHAGEGLPAFDGTEAHAAEQVHREAALGVGGRAARGRCGRRIVHADHAH